MGTVLCADLTDSPCNGKVFSWWWLGLQQTAPVNVDINMHITPTTHIQSCTGSVEAIRVFSACAPDVAFSLTALCVVLKPAGTVSCFIMERFAPGINFMLSAELEHSDKNYKFGFGFTVGE